jgi:integrase
MLLPPKLDKLPVGFHLIERPGLHLQVTGPNAKSWVYRYTSPTTGRVRYLGLGGANSISLEDAKEAVREPRKQRAQGIDPIDAARAKREAAKPVPTITFGECAQRYFETHKAGWRHAKHIAAWESSLRREIRPGLGHLAPDAVDTAAVLSVLQPRWKTSPIMANKTRARLEQIIDYCTAHGYRTGDNPARGKGHMHILLGDVKRREKTEHHEAMAYKDVPAFMKELAKREGSGPRALEFVILTACRTAEVLGAQWHEVDLTNAVWTIPAERMKVGKAHKVPLSTQAVALLKRMEDVRESDTVFPGYSRKQPTLHAGALIQSLRKMGHGAITTHGFRSAFRDWAAECTDHPREVAELSLAHQVGSEVERAYRRTSLFDRRRALMQEWADYIVY